MAGDRSPFPVLRPSSCVLDPAFRDRERGRGRKNGNWNEIEAAFKIINGGDSSAGHSSQRSPSLTYVWPAIIDAYGVAEQVNEWPAQQLLDYGHAVLSSLRPGMVYVGGTDNGRWIPELPLGPLMELRAQTEQNTFTPERAIQSVDYWNNAASRILLDPEAAGSSAALKSYSHDTVSAANLLAAHNFTA